MYFSQPTVFLRLFSLSTVSKIEKNNHISALTKSLTPIVDLHKTTLLLAAQANCSRMNVKILGNSSSRHSFKRLKAEKWQKLS